MSEHATLDDLLAALAASAPEGYRVPLAAKKLLNLAHRNGWGCRATWGAAFGGKPFLTVAVRRSDPVWEAKLTWHSMAQGLQEPPPAGSLRLFSAIWRKEKVVDYASSTSFPVLIENGWYWRDLPSVKALGKAIEANPVKRENS